MNKRIQELLEQAGVKYAVMPKDTVYEKFAELIVGECVGLFDSKDTDSCYPPASVQKIIKKHFGVKE